MHFNLKINGTKHAFEIPTYWSGVSVRQFQRLAQASLMVEQLAALTGIEADVWGEYLNQASIE